MIGKLIIAALGLTVAAGTAVAAANMDELLAPCVSCHDMDGIGSTPKTPLLNWQLPAYLIETMQAMQAGARPTAVPKHIPKTMTREQIVTIADFYGKNRKPRTPQPYDAEKATKGFGVHQDRCADCHLENGRATDDKGAASPILAGQPVEYLLAQERLYMSGKRRFAPQADRAHKDLTNEEIEAVSHFYASIDPKSPQSAGADGNKRKRRSGP